MIKRIELLVHAGAPSGRKDDDRYKAQAEAYSHFLGRRANLTEVLAPSASSSLQPSRQHAAEYQDDAPAINLPAVFLDDTQLAITGLESQLLTSSLPIASGKAVAKASPNQSGKASSSPCDEANAGAGERDPKNNLLAQIRSFGKRKRDERLDETPDASLDGDQQDGDKQHGHRSQTRETRSSSARSLSSYLKTPILDRSAKKRRLEHGAGRRTSPAAVPPSFAIQAGIGDGIGHAGRASHATIGHRAPAATAPAGITRSQGSLPVSEPTSELPTSYSLSDITSESSRARPGVSQQATSHANPVTQQCLSSSDHVDTSTASVSNDSALANREEVAQPSSKLPLDTKATREIVVIPDDTPTAEAPPALAHRQAGSRQNTDKAPGGEVRLPSAPFHGTAQEKKSDSATAASAEALQTLQNLPTSIHAPEPDISIKPFTTHITPALANLAANRDMTGRYNLASVSRDVRPLERGHWLFDSSSWSAEKQVHFWQFLEKAVGNGSAGWGVWCTREAEVEDPGSGPGLGTVKVYCWGEVVKHVYLLLYVASMSQIRKVGARWVDAEGKLVVQMKKAG